MFHQTFELRDLLVVLMLIVLEGVLSIDNALVLGLLAKRLPKPLQKKALTYGLFGALIFRFISIAVATSLLRWRLIKLLGGGYLVYVAVKNLFFESKPESVKIDVDSQGRPIAVDEKTGKPLDEEALGEELFRQTHGFGPDYEHITSTHTREFWYAVGAIELTDLAFAVDSILAAIALVGSPPPGTPAGQLHPKLWVIITGGMIGVIVMRFAAILFIRLLEKFPRFELSAYLLVAVIGAKLVVDWAFNAYEDRVNFHSPDSLFFWIFWILMLVSLGVGFLPARRQGQSDANA